MAVESRMNLTLYVPKDIEDELKKRAAEAGTTPSLFVQSVLRVALAERAAAFTPAFAALAGSWEDDRTPEEIIADIGLGRVAVKRPALR